MKTIKGPGIFLAQFLGDTPPFNTLDSIADYMASLGYKGLQIPTNDPAIFDVKKAAESKTYADEIKGKLKEKGLEITELSTHLQGQLVASTLSITLYLTPSPLRKCMETNRHVESGPLNKLN